MEIERKGIRVNAVFPGGINTPMGNVTGEAAEELKKYYQAYPIRRIGEPEEVARANLFLASDDSSFCCGAESNCRRKRVLEVRTASQRWGIRRWGKPLRDPARGVRGSLYVCARLSTLRWRRSWVS